MDRSSSKKSICGSIISLEKKSLIEFFQKNVPSSTLYSNHSNTYISTANSTHNRRDNIAGKSYHSNEKIANKAGYNNSFIEFSNNQSCPYYQHSFSSYDSSWKSVNTY